MLDDNYMEVDFETYCAKCKYQSTDEVKDPCNECLDDGMRESTQVPKCYEEAED